MTMNQLVSKDGYRLSVLYHSHVEVGAYFSETDRKSALLNGEPSYPGTIYLVLSVRKRDRIEIDEASAFRWDPALRDFGAIDWRKPDG
jgi:proteasome lid subunit RPN8/RPN11